MQFVYHLKPQKIIGDALVSLNALNEISTELYNAAIEKYVGREYIMQIRLPILNCLWNEVVHLSPIHPQKIYDILEPLIEGPRTKREWLEIPITSLSESSTITFSCPPVLIGSRLDISTAECKPFSTSEYVGVNNIPPWTIKYYKDELAVGRKPLLFNGLIHVLTMGKVELSKAETIVC
jgi:hypothetical protein